MSGSILSILSAATFGLNRIFIRRGVTRVADPTVGVMITVPFSLFLFLLILVVRGRVHDIVSFPWQNYVWLAVAGLTNFVAGRMLSYTAVQLVGANITSVLGRVAPIIAAIIGISFLGESLTWEIIAGVLLIVCGVGVVSWNPKLLSSTGSRNIFSNISSRGILLAFGAGFFLGVSPVFIKLGLYASLSPVAAAFIAYFTATIALSIFLLGQGKRTTLFGMRRRALLFFGLAGLLTTIAQLSRYTALSISPVSVVSPLISTSTIFLLGFSFLFNRKLEIFSLPVIIGAIITAVGAILLILI